MSTIMDGYTKLHAKIVFSSIWNEPDHVRLLWITLLATADADGNVEGSVGGLAHLARISPKQCEHALQVLSSPDPDSGDETTGERIQKVGPGLWHIINHGLYRDRQTRKQARQAKWVKEKRSRTKASTTPDSQTEADTNTNTYTGAVDTVDMSTPSEKGETADVKSAETEKEKLRREWEKTGFLEFYNAYGKKADSRRAFSSWKRLTKAQRAAAMERVPAYVAATPDVQFRKNAATWLNQRCWEDEMIAPHVKVEKPRVDEAGEIDF